jgi:hypothetical protein
MVDRNQERANGRTAGDDIAREAMRDFDKTTEVELPEERARRFRTAGFSRMPTSWEGADATTMHAVHHQVTKLIDENFEDAFLLMYEIFDIVREVETDDKGEAKLDEHDLPIWRKTVTGRPVESWENLTFKQRERFIFQINTRLMDWRLRASELWAEAMFSKAKWEDEFSIGYEELEGSKPTIGDREARGRLASRESRYFAIYASYLSRKADAVVSVMEQLSQRLKDVHVSNGSR